MLRVRLINYENAQVLALSMNHGLCDAAGIGAFMTAWSEAYRGGSGMRDVSNDRVGTYPPSPEMGQPALSNSDDVPDHWRQVRHLPEALPETETLVIEPPMHVCYKRSKTEIASLKEQCMSAAGVHDVQISTNDAITAELVTALGCKEEEIPIGTIKEFRKLVGAATVFANMWCPIDLLVRNSLAAAIDMRKALPSADSAEFIRWSIGQCIGGGNYAWKSKLTVNTWAKAFALKDIAFDVEASDVMLGHPMMRVRAQMMAPAGICYSIVLPARDGGVKVAAVLPEAAAKKLQADGLDVTWFAS
jgi:hypothetical protein